MKIFDEELKISASFKNSWAEGARERWRARQRRRHGYYLLHFTEGETEARLYEKGRLTKKTAGPRIDIGAEEKAATVAALQNLLLTLDPELTVRPLLLLLDDGSIETREAVLPPGSKRDWEQAIQWELTDPGRRGGPLLWQGLILPSADATLFENEREEDNKGVTVAVLAVKEETTGYCRELARALGLPLEAVSSEKFFSEEEARAKLNLLPCARSGSGEEANLWQRAVPRLLAAEAVLIVFITVGVFASKFWAQTELAEAQRTQETWGAWVTERRTYTALEKKVKILRKEAEEATAGQRPLQPLLAALQEATRSQIYLEEVEQRRDETVIAGRAAQLAAVQTFCRRLQERVGCGETRILETREDSETPGRPWLSFKVLLSAEKEGR